MLSDSLFIILRVVSFEMLGGAKSYQMRWLSPPCQEVGDRVRILCCFWRVMLFTDK